MRKSKRSGKVEVEEDFSAPGRLESAVPPVEMTDMGWWMMWESHREETQERPASKGRALHEQEKPAAGLNASHFFLDNYKLYRTITS